MTSLSSISSILKQYHAGDEVTVTFYRYGDGETKSTKLTFAENR
ncbi:MAG: hypothetical protein GX866_08680 [Firmicutes bacterium]|nr:hypothetical protein [Bacillota bacterium]